MQREFTGKSACISGGRIQTTISYVNIFVSTQGRQIHIPIGLAANGATRVTRLGDSYPLLKCITGYFQFGITPRVRLERAHPQEALQNIARLEATWRRFPQTATECLPHFAFGSLHGKIPLYAITTPSQDIISLKVGGLSGTGRMALPSTTEKLLSSACILQQMSCIKDSISTMIISSVSFG
jgi:hypothetical protein